MKKTGMDNRYIAEESGWAILLFDGKCNFCNRWVNFIIRNDSRRKFRFAALQSEKAKGILKQYTIPEDNKSVVLVFNGKVYLKSTAALHIFLHLGGIYSVLFAFVIFPAFARDFYYDIIARNRYKWWGMRNECMIPAKEVRDRFLE
jgi:predicted DCC family thiol-disulfide oxidoreductase YuxK